MFKSTSLLYSLILLLLAHSLVAQQENDQSAWDSLIRENSVLEEQASALEREILQLMTREQLDAYLEGASPAKIVLLTGETLEALLLVGGSNTFDLSWHSIDGGGDMAGSGGDFRLSGTIGQPDAGLMNSDTLSLRGGFWVRSNFGEPTLSIPTDIPAVFGTPVDVPIVFEGSGFDIAATTFSVDYDESCLGFNPADSDIDGIPDNVSFSLPAGFNGEVTFDASDSDGELDFVIVDPLSPLASLPDGTIVTITLMPLCEPVDASITAPVGFSTAPPPTYGSTEGQDVQGGGIDGSVVIHRGTRGDCNGDDLVSAGDLTACVLEVFDGDGDFWLAVPGGSFEGVPVGCDANGDEFVNAGDLSCKILLIFEGPGACGGTRRFSDGWGKPVLFMETPRPNALQARASVPVYFRPRGWAINSLAFSVDYDERAYALDPSDRDGDGIPDALSFDLPASAQVTVIFDPADADGEIDVSILDPSQAIDRDVQEPLLTMALKSEEPGKPNRVKARFSRDPAASFGEISGRSVEGSTSTTPRN